MTSRSVHDYPQFIEHCLVQLPLSAGLGHWANANRRDNSSTTVCDHE
ncbi:MAG TPA: hypothetical protein VF788_15420 [Pseudonocardiaceae bacterium]